MSDIPPNWLTSIAGSGGAQHQSGAHKLKEAADQARRSGATPFADNLHNVIENSDKDGEVYSDSEGLGSQGRAPQDEDQPENPPESQESPAGGLDVQA